MRREAEVVSCFLASPKSGASCPFGPRRKGIEQKRSLSLNPKPEKLIALNDLLCSEGIADVHAS